MVGPLEAALLGAIRGTGESDGAVERAAGLPQAWLSKARKGERSGPKATPSWERLRSWLVTKLGPAAVAELEVGARRGTPVAAVPAPEVAPAEAAAASAPPSSAPPPPSPVRATLAGLLGSLGRPLVPPSASGVPGESIPEELAREIDAANTYEELSAVLKKITSALIRGDVDRFAIHPAVELLKERRAVVKEAEREAAGRALGQLEPMLPEQLEEWRAFQESKARAPLGPRESVSPPAPPVVEEDRTAGM